MTATKIIRLFVSGKSGMATLDYSLYYLFQEGRAVTIDQCERMNLVCALIQHERNLKRYRELVAELSELLCLNERQLEALERHALQEVPE